MATDVFSIEALQAGRGDCLLIQAGKSGSPRFFLIDGGPAGVCNQSLLPRLTGIRNSLNSGGDLALEMCMVSHIDDDHIRGIIDLASKIDQGESIRIVDYWFNSFDDALGNIPAPLRGSMASLASVGDPQSLPDPNALPDGMSELKAVFASVAQGRNLRRQIKLLGARLNGGGDALLMSGSGQFKFAVSNTQDVTFEVLLPSKARLRALYEKWEEDLRNGAGLSTLAANADKSVANLSSLVVLATSLGKTMLLTGDARGDDILEGLREAGHLVGEKLTVDILKLQHHGSNRNVTREFFDTVRARHIVISGNGEHDNPDLDTLNWIADSYKNDPDMQCHLTYGEHSDLPPDPVFLQTLRDLRQSQPAFMSKLLMPQAGDTGARVDLGAVPAI